MYYRANLSMACHMQSLRQRSILEPTNLIHSIVFHVQIHNEKPSESRAGRMEAKHRYPQLIGSEEPTLICAQAKTVLRR
jgi:hypothetical protein